MPGIPLERLEGRREALRAMRLEGRREALRTMRLTEQVGTARKNVRPSLTQSILLQGNEPQGRSLRRGKRRCRLRNRLKPAGGKNREKYRKSKSPKWEQKAGKHRLQAERQDMSRCP